MKTSESIESLENRRTNIMEQIAALGDLRAGSISTTTGKCGKANCRCHQPKGVPHGPNIRFTYKVNGKTVSESLPDPAAIQKAEKEIAEFRKLQTLHKELVAVNAQICPLRPPQTESMSSQEKKRSKRSAGRSRAS